MLPFVSQHYKVSFGGMKIPLSGQIMWLVSFVLCILNECIKSQIFDNFQVRLKGIEVSAHHSIIYLVNCHLEEGIHQHLRSEVRKLRMLEQRNTVDFI